MASSMVRDRDERFETLLADAKEFFRVCREGMLKGREWLAEAFAEFVEMRDTAAEVDLALAQRPAWKAAEAVRELKRKHRETARQLKLLQYEIATYQEYFPEIQEFRNAILDEQIPLVEDKRSETTVDPAVTLEYLSPDEYAELPTTVRFQRALDRYWERPKSDWEIGRVYERFVGYLYEQQGFDVEYHGIIKGFEDLGRDLVCRNSDTVLVVQCKCWSKEKVIREKHLFQLYGTSVLQKIDEENEPNTGRLFSSARQVRPVFVTTTSFSEIAVQAAQHLNVELREEELRRWPMIKCNVSRSGDRIYHLPFDQQYDRVIIRPDKGDSYAASIKEAEERGFRRAFRWSGLGKGSTEYQS